jgi:hypothetical protein
MVFTDKDHPRCIGVISAEPQNTDFRPSHILTLGPYRKILLNFPTNLIQSVEYSARFLNLVFYSRQLS